MHEYRLVECMMENGCDALTGHDALPVLSIEVRVGALCQVVPPLFQTAFWAVTAVTRTKCAPYYSAVRNAGIQWVSR